jgi:hypothetical protein
MGVSIMTRVVSYLIGIALTIGTPIAVLGVVKIVDVLDSPEAKAARVANEAAWATYNAQKAGRDEQARHIAEMEERRKGNTKSAVGSGQEICSRLERVIYVKSCDVSIWSRSVDVHFVSGVPQNFCSTMPDGVNDQVWIGWKVKAFIPLNDRVPIATCQLPAL